MVRVGQKLQEVRIKKGLSLEQVAKDTKIKASFLLAIERGEYQKLPSVTYVQGFVRNYADYLDLSTPEFLALFRREFDAKRDFKVLPEGFTDLGNLRTNSLVHKDKLMVMFFIALLFLAYIVFQYRQVFINPSLEITSPHENEVISSQNIEVKGKTDSNATVYIDNVAVPVDKNGLFAKNIDLFEGKASIEIKAVNRFNKQTIIERNVEIVVDNKK